MNLLLDTHVLLWWLGDDPLLPETAREAIGDTANLLILSAAVVWDIRIKQALGKLSIAPEFYDVKKGQGFEMLHESDQPGGRSRTAVDAFRLLQELLGRCEIRIAGAADKPF